MPIESAETPPPVRDHIALLTALGVEFDPTLTRRSKRHARAKEMDGRIGHGVQNFEEGARNSTLASIAGGMRARGATEQEILTGLRHVNASQVNPPLDDAEVASVAASISSYPPGAGASAQARSLNDTGNAHRVVDDFGDQIRFVVRMGQWYIWDDQRWRLDDKAQMIEIAKVTAKRIYTEAANCPDPGLAKAIAKHANKSLDVARIKAMVDLAKSDPAVVTVPEALDLHDELLGVSNGIVDLPTGKLRPARSEDLITKHAPVVFDPTARCPTWWRFLNRVMGNNGNKLHRHRGKLLVKYLQRVVGYALSGRTDEQVLFFLFGCGANGKTTFLKIVEDLLGRELSCQLPYDALVARKQPRSATNEIARLQGMRAVFTNEVEDGTRLAESLVKQLTGSDTMTARFLYGEFFDFDPKFKLFIAGNHKPVIRGDDLGIWRRLQLVPFEVTIPENERDPRLLEKLRAELPGILNWAIRGYRMWRKQRLSPPPAVIDAGREYRDEMDILKDWVTDCCDVGPTFTLRAADGYRSYAQWAKDNGYSPMSAKSFGRKLAERYMKKKLAAGNVYAGLDVLPTIMQLLR
ncbi:MAG: primase C-terminal domain-containing protein [Burkholderiales bacterium]|nr:primase C-terminal domain-containing protein [Burkholderiales bacterium]